MGGYYMGRKASLLPRYPLALRARVLSSVALHATTDVVPFALFVLSACGFAHYLGIA